MMNKSKIYFPDYIFYNGNVHTVDAEDNIYEAAAVSGNKIAAVGSNDEIMAMKTDKTVLIDLKGRSLIPGINDAHNHAWETGLMLEGIVLFGIDSMKMLQEKIIERINEVPEGTWIQGGSWIESQFEENRAPNRYDLDAASPHNAVVLERIFGACSVNSKALELAGINKDTVDPPKGHIEKDENEEPTGVLHGNAVLLVRKVMPGPFGSDDFGAGEGEPSIPVLEKSIALAIKEYNKYGITSITEPGVSSGVCKAYHDLLKKNELRCRINLMPNWHGFTLQQNEKELDQLLNDYDFSSGYGNDWIRYSSLKMAIDGGLTSMTALKSWNYKGEDSLREFPLRLDITKLDEYIKSAHDSGWDIGIHVMGDVAIDKAVDAIYKAVKANPRKHQHSIIHAYYPSEETLKKMSEVGIMVAAQASFIYVEADGYDSLLPRDKQTSFTPLKTYKDNGIVVSLTTDMPCSNLNPFINMYAAVTRKGSRGYSLGDEEKINKTEALRMMTYNGAVLNGEENFKGSIEADKLADLVIIDRNLSQVPDEEIKNIKVDFTMLDGKIIYQR